MVSDKNLKRFEHAVKNLNQVILDCKKENPDCFAYLDASNSLHLLDGSADIGDAGDHESIIAWGRLDAGGGDW